MKKIALALVAVSALGLAACQQSTPAANEVDTNTANTVNEALEDTNAALDAAGNAIENAGATVENAADAAADAAENAVTK